MATRQPGASTSFPNGQAREQFGRDWGNYASAATLPNAAGNVLPASQFTLEAGDRAYLIVSGTSGLEYLCVSAGTAGGGDAVWIVNSGGLGPWSSVLYVDNVRGNDTTGTRGDDNLPFATVQAALNAMQTNDAVLLAPQTFTLTAPLTVPAPVVRGSCTGFGGNAPRLSNNLVGTTRIVNGGVFLALWNFATLGITDFRMSQMECVATGGTLGISADGSAYAKDTFFSGGLFLQNMVLFSGGITIKYASVMALDNVVSFPVTVVSCAAVAIANLTTLISSAFSYDATDPLAPTAQLSVAITNCSSPGGITFGPGQPQLSCDATSALASDITGTGLSVVGAKLPKLSVLGVMRGNVFLNAAGQELPDTASVLTMDFRGAKLVAAVPAISLVYRFKVAGVAANFQTVRMDSATAQPGTTFLADVGIHLTMRGTVAPLAVYSTPGVTGDILPPSPLIIAPTAVASNPQPIAYPCRIPAGSTAVTAFVASDNAAAVPTQVISSTSTTGFSAGLNALPFDVPHLSGLLTGAAGAVVAYAGDEPTSVALVPVNYPIGRACRVGVLKVYVSTNGLATATTFTLYKNNVATAITLSVGAGATGIFSDTTHTVDFALNDRYDLRLDNTAGLVSTMVFGASFEMFINPLAGNLYASVSFPG